jgi:ferredoxin
MTRLRRRTIAGDRAAMERLNRRVTLAASTPGAPYWLDYLCRERTMCSLCRETVQHNVRIGPPIPPDINRPGQKAAFRARQRAAFVGHVANVHPGLKVRWAR